MALGVPILKHFRVIKQSQDTIKPIISTMVGWLVGCFGLNGPLRQYFSLYQAVSQREGERKEK